MLMSGSWNGARCDLFDLHMSFPTPPADCDLDWGHASNPADGRAGPVCAGDTVADPGPGAGLRQVGDDGRGHLPSSETGLTCQNSQGHGFAVARARQSSSDSAGSRRATRRASTPDSAFHPAGPC